MDLSKNLESSNALRCVKNWLKMAFSTYTFTLWILRNQLLTSFITWKLKESIEICLGENLHSKLEKKNLWDRFSGLTSKWAILLEQTTGMNFQMEDGESQDPQLLEIFWNTHQWVRDLHQMKTTNYWRCGENFKINLMWGASLLSSSKDRSNDFRGLKQWFLQKLLKSLILLS